MSDLGEAPIIMFTNYKRTDGFEVSLTLRGDDLRKVATDLDTAIKAISEKGGLPIAKNFSKFPAKAEVPTKPCPKHNQPMRERQGKDGKPNYFSHNRGVYPNLEWCSGSGFPGDLKQEVEESFDTDDIPDLEGRI